MTTARALGRAAMASLRRLRPVAVLAVLAGVLAMHALTVGHHPGSHVGGSADPAVAAVAVHDHAAAPGSARDVRAIDPRPAGGHAVPTTRLPVDPDGCGNCGHGAPDPSHSGSHLLDLCIAVLLAATVTLLLLLVARSPAVAHALTHIRRAVTPVAVRRRPPGPSLSQLCVLRT
jgi:uncharacterized protein DUF6153